MATGIDGSMNHSSQADHEALTADAAEERDYMLRRAGDHRRLANRTAEAGSRAIHLRLEQLYMARARTAGLVLPD